MHNSGKKNRDSSNLCKRPSAANHYNSCMHRFIEKATFSGVVSRNGRTSERSGLIDDGLLDQPNLRGLHRLPPFSSCLTKEVISVGEYFEKPLPQQTIPLPCLANENM